MWALGRPSRSGLIMTVLSYIPGFVAVMFTSVQRPIHALFTSSSAATSSEAVQSGLSLCSIPLLHPSALPACPGLFSLIDNK